MEIKIKVENLDRWKRLIDKSPQEVTYEAGNFITTVERLFQKTMRNKPWQVNGSGGGIPVATGNLRDTHQFIKQHFRLEVIPTAEYAGYVHEGTRKMRARPWLRYTAEVTESDITKEANNMIERLAKKMSL